MPNNNLDAQIRARIDSFVEELSALVRATAVESVQEALGAGATAKRGPGRPRKAAAGLQRARAVTRRPRGGKRIRRSSEDVDAIAGAIADYVRINPGCSVSEIGAALKLSTKETRLPIQKLVAERKLKMTGQKRGTRYFPGGRGGTAKKRATKKKATRKKASRKKAGGRRAAKKGRRKKTAKR